MSTKPPDAADRHLAGELEDPFAEAADEQSRAANDDDKHEGDGFILPPWESPPSIEWLKETPPPPRSLVSMRGPNGQIPLMPLGKVGMLVAAGDSGKTWALVQLGVSVATGHPWLGTFDIDQRGRVLLALGEEDTADVQRRLHYAILALRLNAQQEREALQRVRDNIVFWALDGVRLGFIDGKCNDTRLACEVRERIYGAKRDWSLIVFDPLSRWGGPTVETDNYAATRLVEFLQQITKAPGRPTVLVAHHSSKIARAGAFDGDAAGARGSSGLTDGIRWAAEMGPHKPDQKPGEVIERLKFLRGTKANGMPQRLPLTILRHGEGGALEPVPSVEIEKRSGNGQSRSKEASEWKPDPTRM